MRDNWVKQDREEIMAIVSRLDRVMADRKMSVGELSKLIDLSPVNVSRIRTGKSKAVRFSTLNKLCEVLNCQPGDLFEYYPDEIAEEMFE